MKITKMIVAALIMAGISSCSHRLVGTWTIQSYNISENEQANVNVSNIGSLTFNKDNTGEKNIFYSVFQNNYEDKLPFRWFQDSEGTVRIEGENSVFSKTWLIIENGKKEQVWKSTDGVNKVQELRLKKE